MLDRTVRRITADYVGRKRLRGLLLTRLISIYGISTVLFLVRIRRLGTFTNRFAEMRKFLKNAGALAILSTSIPALRGLTGVRDPRVFWSGTIGAALWTATDLPSFLTSFVTVESISESILSMSGIKEALAHMEGSSLVIGRQMLLSLVVPLFYNRVKTTKSNSGAARFLFGKRTLVQDFMLFYSIWNFLSIYNYLKRFLLEKRRSKGYGPQSGSSRLVDDWPMISGNLKPLMDKLGEIHEITLHSSYSLFEKLMNSAAMKNVVPCFRWALWRQLCVKALHHSPPEGYKNTVNTSLMKSITLMLGFFVLDGSNNSMNVRPGTLQYLLRCVLNTYLEGTSLNVRKLITFLFSHLALRNSRRLIN